MNRWQKLSSVVALTVGAFSIWPGVPSSMAQENGFYRNPILFADYSDPDAIRVGDDFIMVSSSFHCAPGIPVIRSRDLVHWTIVSHALPDGVPRPEFEAPQHGRGVWAPSIRHHAGKYWIFYGDPDHGIVRVRGESPAGPWEKPVLVARGKGMIDPCPFWDEDGSAYLVHAWAKSRVGYNSVLTLYRMDAEATALLDRGVQVFDGHAQHPTIEGPKLYKRQGYYYIFAPAGGVRSGWQAVLRSRSIYGPYQDRIVLHQGSTPVNGPHQGAWVQLPTGESWFLHFQDRGPYGRVVHLQPMVWNDDWPVIGADADGDGTGEPVMRHSVPVPAEKGRTAVIQTSDEFDRPAIGLQWQWHANPRPLWADLDGSPGVLRLRAVARDSGNFWRVPNLLLQKFPAEEFSATTRLTLQSGDSLNSAGLIVMGADYARLSLRRARGRAELSLLTCLQADRGGVEKESFRTPVEDGALHLRVSVREGALCRFSYSSDGTLYRPIGGEFQAAAGAWIGAKVGLYCVAEEDPERPGHVEVDWFRVETE